MLRFYILEKVGKLFFKSGMYLDFLLKLQLIKLLKTWGVNIFQFFGEKLVLEYWFRFNQLSQMFL